VTITHPPHPRCGQRCEVVRIRRGVDPDLMVRLQEGAQAARALRWTDAGREPAPTEAPDGHARPLLALQGLRQSAHLIARLRQQRRGPTPRRPPRARAVHRPRPPGTPSSPVATWRCWHGPTVRAGVPCARVGSGLASAHCRPQAAGSRRGGPDGVHRCPHAVRLDASGGQRGARHARMPRSARPM